MAASTTLELVAHELRDRHRTLSMLLAIALGATLVVLAAALGATMDQRVHAGAGANYENADLVVRSQSTGSAPIGGTGPDSVGGTGISADEVRTIAGIDGVEKTDGIVRARAGLWISGKVTPTVIESLPAEDFRWQRLAGGRYPDTGTEVALSTTTLESTGVRLGDEVTLATDTAGDGQFTVVGAVDTRGALDYGDTNYATVTHDLARAFAGTDGDNEVRVALAPGANPQAVIDDINAKAPGAWPETTSSLIEATTTLYGVGLGALTAMVNGFALVAALVSLTVLGTVVAASLPGRRRQLALMRLVGASRTRLVSVLLLESALTALLGGLLAIPMGIGLAYLAMPLLGAIPGVPQIPWSEVVVPLRPLLWVPVVAVLGAVIAVTGPALRAGSVPPSDALRQASGAEKVSVFSTTLQLVLVGILALATALAPLAGAGATVVVTLLFIIAVIFAVPSTCHVAAGLVARIAGNKHPLAEIGAAEIRSFPGRTAATGVAAMLAALVLALSWVALSSLSAVADTRSGEDPGPQLAIGSVGNSVELDPLIQEAASQVEGISSAVPVSIGQVRVSGAASASAGSNGSGNVRLVKDVAVGHAEDFTEVTGGRFPLQEADPRRLYLPASDNAPFKDDTQVTLAGPEGETRLRVEYVSDLPLAGLIAPEVMDGVGASYQTRALWLAVSPDADRADVLNAERTIATIGGDIPVTGTLVADAKIDILITTAQRIATAMLLFTALIAVIGAMVTLAASLADRSREFAVLRLLGMEGPQLRRLVGAETIAVGVICVLVGLAAGTLAGGAVAQAIAGVLGVEARIAVPLLTLGVLGLVTVAGLRIAATGPIDRVSLISPAAALREANHGGKR